MKQAMADMREYEKALRDRGDLLQARAARRCIEILRRASTQERREKAGAAHAS